MGHGSVPQFPRSQVPGRRGYRERRDLGQAHRAPGHSLPSTRRRPRHGLLIATRVLRSSPLGRPGGQSGPRISGRWNGGIFCPVAAQAPCQEQPGPPGWPPAPRQGGARLAGRQGKGSWVLGLRSSRTTALSWDGGSEAKARVPAWGSARGKLSTAVPVQALQACLVLLHVCTRMHLQCVCACMHQRPTRVQAWICTAPCDTHCPRGTLTSSHTPVWGSLCVLYILKPSTSPHMRRKLLGAHDIIHPPRSDHTQHPIRCPQDRPGAPGAASGAVPAGPALALGLRPGHRSGHPRRPARDCAQKPGDSGGAPAPAATKRIIGMSKIDGRRPGRLAEVWPEPSWRGTVCQACNATGQPWRQGLGAAGAEALRAEPGTTPDRAACPPAPTSAPA